MFEVWSFSQLREVQSLILIQDKPKALAWQFQGLVLYNNEPLERFSVLWIESMFDLEHKLCLDDSIFEIPKIEKFEVENVQFILCLIYCSVYL